MMTSALSSMSSLTAKAASLPGWIRDHREDFSVAGDLAGSAALGSLLGNPLGIQLAVFGGIAKEMAYPTVSRHFTLSTGPMHPIDRAIRGVVAHGITAGLAYELAGALAGFVGAPMAAICGGVVAAATTYGFLKLVDNARGAVVNP